AADEAIEVEAAEIGHGAGIHATIELFEEGVESSYGLSFELAKCHRLLLLASRDALGRSGSAQSGRSRKYRRVELTIALLPDKTSGKSGGALRAPLLRLEPLFPRRWLRRRDDWWMSRFLRPRDLSVVRRDYAVASDAELLLLADGEAFAVVYDRQVERVFGWARARVGDRAADLAAEVFGRAWLGRGRFRDQAEGSAWPWLYGIAQNVLRDSLRKRRVEDGARARLGLPLSVVADPGFDAIEQRLSLPEAVARALAELPHDERELLWLRVVEERPYRELATALRCTPEAARTRVSRALRRLRLTVGGQLQ